MLLKEKDMNKILSISIAAYNAEKFLDKCLTSLTNSKRINDIELIIVNDGSNDKTIEIAREYEKKYPDSVRVVDKENGGHGSTINASIRIATGKYFKIVDSDDWVETENLDRLIEFLRESNSDLVLNPYYEVNALDERKKLVYAYELIDNENILNAKFEKYATNIKLAMHAMTFRNDIIKKVGPVIDENCFYVDLEYTLFPIKYLKTISILNYPIYDYLLGTATQSMNLHNLIERRAQHLKVVQRVVEKYEEDFQMENRSRKSRLARNRIVAAIYLQYVLILKARGKKTKEEFYYFDKWLKHKSTFLYRSIARRKLIKSKPYILFIVILRKAPIMYKFIDGIISLRNKV